MKKLINNLKLDETYNKPLKKETKISHLDDNIPHKSGYNFMMDILILPKTKKGYSMLLVCVDLWSKSFDIEPLKNKDAKTVLNAFKEMINRPYIKFTNKSYSLVVDNDGAFKGEFQNYLYNQNVYKKTTEPYRHKTMGLVEAYNKQIGRVLNLYMNQKEKEFQKPYNEWTDIIDYVRTEYNKERLREDGNPRTDIYKSYDLLTKPKFQENDIVYVKSEIPLNALGKKQEDLMRFRVGDYRFIEVPKRIVKVIPFRGDVKFRYIVEGKPNVSYTEDELIKVDEKETKYIFEKIIGMKTINKVKKLLIKWKGYKIDEATYENYDDIKKDLGPIVFNEMYEDFLRSKKK
jgi:hypothetical protein